MNHQPTSETPEPLFKRARIVASGGTLPALHHHLFMDDCLLPERLASPLLFLESLHTHPALQGYHPDASLQRLHDTPIQDLGSSVTAMLYLTGDRITASTHLCSRAQELQNSPHHVTQATAAVVVSDTNPELASELLESAALTAPGALSLFRARYNAAAIALHQHGQSALALDMLENLDDAIRDALDSNAISEGDYSVLRGMTTRLKAFGQASTSAPETVARTLRVACSLATLSNLRVIRPLTAAYHSAQQHLAYALALANLGNTRSAEEVATKNVQYCKQHCRRALPDAHLAHGQVMLASPRPEEAIRSYKRAHHLLIRRGEVARAAYVYEALLHAAPHEDGPTLEVASARQEGPPRRVHHMSTSTPHQGVLSSSAARRLAPHGTAQFAG